MDNLREKLMQALDAERPALPETQYDIGYNNGLTMAMAIVRNLAKDINGPIWIPVKKRLPTAEDANEKGNILAFCKKEGMANKWRWQTVDRYPKLFSHWMPLPEPPKEGAENG